MNKKHFRCFHVLGAVAVAAVFGAVTMFLWNALLPPLFGLPILNWPQAVGLLILCRILFGGIAGGFGMAGLHRHGKWALMSEEQRSRLAEEIKKRHGFGFDHCHDGHEQGEHDHGEQGEKKDH
jgi:hypothetical protein